MVDCCSAKDTSSTATISFSCSVIAACFKRPQGRRVLRLVRIVRKAARSVPFAEYALLLEDLEIALNAIPAQDRLASKRVLNLAKRISDICISDPDACLALVHIYSVEPTAYEQVLFCAILCAITGIRLEFVTNRTIILVAAALSANIALLPHQDKLNSSKMALTEAQRTIVNKHPLLSVAALKAAGVEHPRYLRIIEQHHECYNGQGYPFGLQGDEILPEAKVLALAERYTAMVARRAYRERLCADEARLQILQAYAEDPDQSVYEAMFESMGAYPPGCLVSIGEGETAIVTRQRKSGPPLMYAVISAKGNAYMGGIKRNSSDADFIINGVVVPTMLPALNLDELWGYTRV